MRGLKGLTPLLLIGIAGLAWLLFMSEPGSVWLTSFLSPDPSPGTVIARVVRADGSYKVVRGGDVAVLKGEVTSPIPLRDGDRLEVDADSHALLVLNSQDEFELAPLTAVMLQLWNEKDPNSAIYLNVLAGDLELKKPGVKGRAYVVREGRLYLPGQKATKKPLALTVLRSAPLDMQLADNRSAGDSEFEADTTAGAEPERPSANAVSEPETLSNEYIDEVIASRQSQLQKCWLSRLKDKPGLKGQLVVQFEITRRGKVKELKVADQTLSDEQLQSCVLSVIERVSFRSFTGPEISLSYPINFE